MYSHHVPAKYLDPDVPATAYVPFVRGIYMDPIKGVGSGSVTGAAGVMEFNPRQAMEEHSRLLHEYSSSPFNYLMWLRRALAANPSTASLASAVGAGAEALDPYHYETTHYLPEGWGLAAQGIRNHVALATTTAMADGIPTPRSYRSIDMQAPAFSQGDPFSAKFASIYPWSPAVVGQQPPNQPRPAVDGHGSTIMLQASARAAGPGVLADAMGLPDRAPRSANAPRFAETRSRHRHRHRHAHRTKSGAAAATLRAQGDGDDESANDDSANDGLPTTSVVTRGPGGHPMAAKYSSDLHPFQLGDIPSTLPRTAADLGAKNAYLALPNTAPEQFIAAAATGGSGRVFGVPIHAPRELPPAFLPGLTNTLQQEGRIGPPVLSVYNGASASGIQATDDDAPPPQLLMPQLFPMPERQQDGPVQGAAPPLAGGLLPRSGSPHQFGHLTQGDAGMYGRHDSSALPYRGGHHASYNDLVTHLTGKKPTAKELVRNAPHEPRHPTAWHQGYPSHPSGYGYGATPPPQGTYGQRGLYGHAPRTFDGGQGGNLGGGRTRDSFGGEGTGEGTGDKDSVVKDESTDSQSSAGSSTEGQSLQKTVSELSAAVQALIKARGDGSSTLASDIAAGTARGIAQALRGGMGGGSLTSGTDSSTSVDTTENKQEQVTLTEDENKDEDDEGEDEEDEGEDEETTEQDENDARFRSARRHGHGSLYRRRAHQPAFDGGYLPAPGAGVPVQGVYTSQQGHDQRPFVSSTAHGTDGGPSSGSPLMPHASSGIPRLPAHHGVEVRQTRYEHALPGHGVANPTVGHSPGVANTLPVAVGGADALSAATLHAAAPQVVTEPQDTVVLSPHSDSVPPGDKAAMRKARHEAKAKQDEKDKKPRFRGVRGAPAAPRFVAHRATAGAEAGAEAGSRAAALRRAGASIANAIFDSPYVAAAVAGDASSPFAMRGEDVDASGRRPVTSESHLREIRERISGRTDGDDDRSHTNDGLTAQVARFLAAKHRGLGPLTRAGRGAASAARSDEHAIFRSIERAAQRKAWAPPNLFLQAGATAAEPTARASAPEAVTVPDGEDHGAPSRNKAAVLASSARADLDHKVHEAGAQAAAAGTQASPSPVPRFRSLAAAAHRFARSASRAHAAHRSTAGGAKDIIGAPSASVLKKARDRLAIGQATQEDVETIEAANRAAALSRGVQRKGDPNVPKSKPTGDKPESPAPSSPPPLRKLDRRGLRAMTDVQALAEKLLVAHEPSLADNEGRRKCWAKHVFAALGEEPGGGQRPGDLARHLAHGMRELFDSEIDAEPPQAVPPPDPVRQSDAAGIMANAIDTSGKSRVSDPLPVSAFPLPRPEDDPWHPKVTKAEEKLFFDIYGLKPGGLHQPIEQLLGAGAASPRRFFSGRDLGNGPFGDTAKLSLLQLASSGCD